jgi:hypothetical protein
MLPLLWLLLRMLMLPPFSDHASLLLIPSADALWQRPGLFTSILTAAPLVFCLKLSLRLVEGDDRSAAKR